MSDLRELEGVLAPALGRLSSRTQFAEALAQSEHGEGVTLERRTITTRREPRLRGAVLRAWSGERWIESATSTLDGHAIAEATESIEQGLSKSASRQGPPGASSTLRREWTELPAHPMSEVSAEEMAKLARDVLAWATAVPGVRECHVHIGWSNEERFYLNTAGARCYQVLARVDLGAAPVAIENGRVEFDYVSAGSIGGRERLAYLDEARVTDLARGAAQLLKAGAAPTGEMPVLLDPGTAGTFAHESFGHGTEADQFLRDRSYLRPLLGQVVGPESLTIVDAGSYPDGYGTIRFDDEGRESQRSVLVDRGRFVGALHDRETAAALGARPTGNARRSDFLSRLFVRMTNTYVEPGDWKLEELVKEAKTGVLLEHTTSGIEDPLGGQMQLKVKKGRRIENGELGGVVSSMALSGKVLEFLTRIRGLSRRDDFEMTPGTCGKGHTDNLPVASGGTYLLSRAVVGPA